MKSLTKNLIFFAALFLFGAIVFRFGLSHFLENRSYSYVWFLAALYFIYNFVIGWIFGKRDHESLPLFDMGFRFHFVSYLLFNGVSLAWFLLDLNSQSENIGVVYTTAIVWGFFVGGHYILYLFAQKHAIKGINKEEIFD